MSLRFSFVGAGIGPNWQEHRDLTGQPVLYYKETREKGAGPDIFHAFRVTPTGGVEYSRSRAGTGIRTDVQTFNNTEAVLPLSLMIST